MEIRIIEYNSDEYKRMLEFRNEVMRKPIGLSLYDEDLSSEIDDTILCGYNGNEIIASAIVSPYKNGGAKIRQVAVLKPYRGKGFGKQILTQAINKAKEQGYSFVKLHSRMNAVNFYKRLGFYEYGHIFEEVGLPHIKMKRELI